MRNFNYFCLGLLISVGLFFVPFAFAQMAPYPEVMGPFSPYPPQYNPYLPNPVSGAPSAISQATSAGVNASQSGTATVKIPSGIKIPVPVTQTANVTKAAITQAARACFAGPVAAAACAATAAAVAVVTQKDICYSTVVPGMPYVCKKDPNHPAQSQTQKIWYLGVPACQDAKCTMPQVIEAARNIGGATATVQSSNIEGSNLRIYIYWTDRGYTFSQLAIPSGGAVLPNEVPAPQVPVSDTELAQSLQDKMNADFNNNRKLYDAMKQDEANNPNRDAALNPIQPNTPVSVAAPPVTSPERTVSETKIPKSDGSIDTKTVKEKTTVTPTTTGTTQGDTKTTYPSQTIQTTTITNNVTNNTTTETNTINNLPAEEAKPEEEDISFADSDMPDLPELYEQKYPDGIAGVWRDNKPNVQDTQFWQGVRSMFPNFAGGQCPAWSMSFNIMPGANYGSLPFDTPCWIFQAIGLIILTTAAFTARKIIF